MPEKIASSTEVDSSKKEIVVDISNQLLAMQRNLLKGELNYDVIDKYEFGVNIMFGKIFDKVNETNSDIKPTLYGLATGANFLYPSTLHIFDQYCAFADLRDGEEKNFAGSICGAIQVAKNRMRTKEINENQYMFEYTGVVQHYLEKTKNSSDLTLQQNTKEYCEGLLIGACIDGKFRDELIKEINKT